MRMHQAGCNLHLWKFCSAGSFRIESCTKQPKALVLLSSSQSDYRSNYCAATGLRSKQLRHLLTDVTAFVGKEAPELFQLLSDPAFAGPNAQHAKPLLHAWFFLHEQGSQAVN